MALPAHIQEALSRIGLSTTQAMTPSATQPAAQTPVTPSTIVTTTPSPASFFSSIPTPIKLIGAGVLAFLGYKTFLAKPKAKSTLSGWRYRR